MNCSLRVLRGWGALSLCWAVLSWCPPAAASGIDPTQLRPDGTIDWGSETIVRIEEDWLLDIAVTDENSTAPEIVTTFGPGDPATGLHAVFEMNHSTYPSFVKGGMQIQTWWGPSLLGARRHPNGAEMSTIVERIQFTCVTRVQDHLLTMEITNGDSVTYGTFGGDHSLRLRLYSELDDLNNYRPLRSVQHSRVTFGANRVNRYLRTAIRYYTAGGDIITDETDVYVHSLVAANGGPAPINP